MDTVFTASYIAIATAVYLLHSCRAGCHARGLVIGDADIAAAARLE